MTVSANEEKIAEKRGKCGKRVLKNGTFVLEERLRTSSQEYKRG